MGAFWVSQKASRSTGWESHQPLLVPPSHHLPGSFSISQLQIRVWPSASSSWLFQLQQHKDIYPEAAPMCDKQRRCPEGTEVREIPRKLWAREVPGDWTQKRKDHVLILLSAAETTIDQAVMIKSRASYSGNFYLLSQVMGTLSTCQKEKHSDWGHKSCISKKSSPSSLSEQSSLRHHYIQQPYKNSAKR